MDAAFRSRAGSPRGTSECTSRSAASGTCAERPRFSSVLDGAEGVASDRNQGEKP